MNSSQIRHRHLRSVFRPESLVDAQLARLCVLYEDFRIEITAVQKVSLPDLDILDSPPKFTGVPGEIGRYRRFYFVRRSKATLKEFLEAIHLLDANPEFQTMLSRFKEPF
jgi:hypothetical protein